MKVVEGSERKRSSAVGCEVLCRLWDALRPWPSVVKIIGSRHAGAGATASVAAGVKQGAASPVWKEHGSTCFLQRADCSV